jgi:hypothetical protein
MADSNTLKIDRLLQNLLEEILVLEGVAKAKV